MPGLFWVWLLRHCLQREHLHEDLLKALPCLPPYHGVWASEWQDPVQWGVRFHNQGMTWDQQPWFDQQTLLRCLARLATSRFPHGRLLLAFSPPLNQRPQPPLLRLPYKRSLDPPKSVHPLSPVVSQEGALEEAQNENEKLKEKISGLKQQYGPIGKQGRVILQQLGKQLGRHIGGMFGYIIKAGEVLEKRRKPKGKIHDILPLAIHNVKSEWGILINIRSEMLSDIPYVREL